MTTLAFYCGPGRWRDAVIRQATGSIYSHCEIVNPDGECISASKRDGNRVRQKPISFKAGHWSFLTTHHDAAETWARAEALLGAPYDTWGALIGGGLGVPYHIRPDAWYCNEMICHCLCLPQPWPAHPGALWGALTKERRVQDE